MFDTKNSPHWSSKHLGPPSKKRSKKQNNNWVQTLNLYCYELMISLVIWERNQHCIQHIFPCHANFWGGRWNLYWLGSIIPLSSYNILSSRNVVKTNNNIVLCFHYLDIQWWCCAVIYHYNERVTVALTIFTDICVNNVIKNVYDELYPVKLLPVLILHSLNYTMDVSLFISPLLLNFLLLTVIEIEKIQKGKCISQSSEARQTIWN